MAIGSEIINRVIERIADKIEHGYRWCARRGEGNFGRGGEANKADKKKRASENGRRAGRRGLNSEVVMALKSLHVSRVSVTGGRSRRGNRYGGDSAPGHLPRAVWRRARWVGAVGSPAHARRRVMAAAERRTDLVGIGAKDTIAVDGLDARLDCDAYCSPSSRAPSYAGVRLRVEFYRPRWAAGRRSTRRRGQAVPCIMGVRGPVGARRSRRGPDRTVAPHAAGDRALGACAGLKSFGYEREQS